MNKNDLLALKDKVDKAQTQVSTLKGQQQAQMKQLKDDWGCSTVEEAEKKLQQMEDDLQDLEKQIKTESETLEAKLNLEES